MDLEKIVCSCLGVTNGMIKDAVDSGAYTLADVQRQTGAGTACCACTDDIQRLIDYFATEREK